MRAIELVAQLVPPNGSIVEVGSLFGASSWAWAKSADPTVTVHCLDPWEKNIGVKPIEDRYGIKYDLEHFLHYTSDCENIVPHKGYSPFDFSDWLQPVDLVYEDAVHEDPTLSANLDFWENHLKPTGILCGDDFRGRFPDVRAAAHRKSDEMNRELIVVENFWCLLPTEHRIEKLESVRCGLLALRDEFQNHMKERGDRINWRLKNEICRGSSGSLNIELFLTLDGLQHWPSQPSDQQPKAIVNLLDKQSQEIVAVFSGSLESSQLDPDIEQKVTVRNEGATTADLVERELEVQPRLLGPSKEEAIVLDSRTVKLTDQISAFTQIQRLLLSRKITSNHRDVICKVANSSCSFHARPRSLV